jgi:hypothetical protein
MFVNLRRQNLSPSRGFLFRASPRFIRRSERNKFPDRLVRVQNIIAASFECGFFHFRCSGMIAAMFKLFLIKKLLKSQLKDVPDAELDKFIAIVEKNPELFKKIAEEIQAKTSGGMDQMQATMAVMKSHEAELKGIVGK